MPEEAKYSMFLEDTILSSTCLCPSDSIALSNGSNSLFSSPDLESEIAKCMELLHSESSYLLSCMGEDAPIATSALKFPSTQTPNTLSKNVFQNEKTSLKKLDCTTSGTLSNVTKDAQSEATSIKIPSCDQEKSKTQVNTELSNNVCKNQNVNLTTVENAQLTNLDIEIPSCEQEKTKIDENSRSSKTFDLNSYDAILAEATDKQDSKMNTKDKFDQKTDNDTLILSVSDEEALFTRDIHEKDKTQIVDIPCINDRNETNYVDESDNSIIYVAIDEDSFSSGANSIPSSEEEKTESQSAHLQFINGLNNQEDKSSKSLPFEAEKTEAQAPCLIKDLNDETDSFIRELGRNTDVNILRAGNEVASVTTACADVNVISGELQKEDICVNMLSKNFPNKENERVYAKNFDPYVNKNETTARKIILGEQGKEKPTITRQLVDISTNVNENVSIGSTTNASSDINNNVHNTNAALQLLESRNPVPSYFKEEENDIIDPGWDEFKQFTSDNQQYELVKRCWDSKTVPNPNTNLSYHSFRKKNIKLLPPREEPQPSKRKATSSLPNQSKRQRTCTYVLDKAITTLNMERDAVANKLRIQMDKELNKKEMDDYTQSMIHYSFGEKFQLCQTQWRKKLDSINYVRDEMIKFNEFYRGLNGADPMMLTSSQVIELDEMERIFNKFKEYYHDQYSEFHV